MIRAQKTHRQKPSRRCRPSQYNFRVTFKVSKHIPGWLLLIGAILLPACGASPSTPQNIGKPLVLVTMGASDAVGIGASDPSKTGWVPRLYQMLPTGTKLINLGISGATVQDALDGELPVALDADPDYVVIWLAVNDLRAGVPLATYDQNLDTLLNALTSRTRAKIVVANMPGLTGIPVFRETPAEKLTAETESWNKEIARTADKYGAVVADLGAYGVELAEHPEFISKDGFHPNDEGYKRLAAILWDTMVSNRYVEKSRA